MQTREPEKTDDEDIGWGGGGGGVVEELMKESKIKIETQSSTHPQARNTNKYHSWEIYKCQTIVPRPKLFVIALYLYSL